MAAERAEFDTRLSEEINGLLEERVYPDELEDIHKETFDIFVYLLATPELFPSQPINFLMDDLSEYLAEESIRVETQTNSKIQRPAYKIERMKAEILVPVSYGEFLLAATAKGDLGDEIRSLVSFASRVRDSMDARFFSDFSGVSVNTLKNLIDQRARTFAGEALATYARLEKRFVPDMNDRWLIEDYGRHIADVDSLIPGKNFTAHRPT